MQQSSDILYAKQQLQNWGYWCHQIITQGLNFSSISIEGQLMVSKGVIIKSTAPMKLPTNHHAEIINQVVTKLGKSHPQLARVLHIHYVMDKSSTVKIRHMKTSKKTYYQHLQQAHTWVSQQLKIIT